jgi:membrane associated rhomboid family serine protease
MTVSLAQYSVISNEASILAWSLIFLGIALIVGLSIKRRESILVDLFIMALVAIHITQILVATYQPLDYSHFLLRFAFIPARYIAEYGQWAPGGWPAYLWTPFSYAFLHGNGLHVFSNGLALFIFGRTVAWRLGGLGFLAVFAASSAVGAITYLIFNWGSTQPLIGASARAFGVLGATFRFVPRADDRLKALFWPDQELRQLPLAGVWEMVTERRSLVYIFLCFIIYPLGLIALLAGTSGNVAVTAHVGGIAFGVFGMGYFDRRRPAFQMEQPHGEDTDTKTEPFGLKVLRVIAVILMAVGIILGVNYYLQAFLN